ncbi:alpha/beta hydrolase [Rhodovibrionaceae bacterium A322]
MSETKASPATANSDPQRLDRPDGATIAYLRHLGKGLKSKKSSEAGKTGLIFLGGFMSDMTGTKATFLENYAKERGRSFVRFDYLGHGQSSGAFTEGTIGRWAEDAVAVIDELTEGPQILIGSSMGGWIMLLAALQRKERIVGLQGIAAAPDFTESLMWETFSESVKETLMRDGVYKEPNNYSDEPYSITLKLIEDGRHHLLMGGKIDLDCPVHLLHGMADLDVPYQLSVKLARRLNGDHVQVQLIKDGDHRLSEPDNLETLTNSLDRLLAQIEG